MKKIIFFLLIIAAPEFIHAQDAATNHAEFKFEGKTYTADYDNAKHLLTMSEEVSIEIYDQSGSCVKRAVGIKVDFKPLLKAGEKQTFTLRFYKKAKTKKSKKKNASINQKGEIGTMVIEDEK